MILCEFKVVCVYVRCVFSLYCFCVVCVGVDVVCVCACVCGAWVCVYKRVYV